MPSKTALTQFKLAPDLHVGRSQYMPRAALLLLEAHRKLKLHFSCGTFRVDGASLRRLMGAPEETPAN